MSIYTTKSVIGLLIIAVLTMAAIISCEIPEKEKETVYVDKECPDPTTDCTGPPDCEDPEKVTDENACPISEGDGTSPSPDADKLELIYNNLMPFAFQVSIKGISNTEEVCLHYGEPDKALFQAPLIEISSEQDILSDIYGVKAGTDYQLTAVLTGPGGSKVLDTAGITTPDAPDYVKPGKVEFHLDQSTIDEGYFSREEVLCFNQQGGAGLSFHICTNRDGVPVWYSSFENYTIYYFTPLRNGNFAALLANWSASPAELGVAIVNMNGEINKFIDFRGLQAKTDYPHTGFHHDLIEITEGDWDGSLVLLTNAQENFTYNPPAQKPDPNLDNDYLGYEHAQSSVPVEEAILGDGFIVFDPDTEEVLYDWSSLGAPNDNKSFDPEKLPLTRRGIKGSFITNSHEVDWLHANSLVHGIDSGGDFFWLSLRAQDWIIKVRPSNFGKVEWRFGYRGDFSLIDSSGTLLDNKFYMYGQHAPEWTAVNGDTYKFLVYDNGTVRPGESLDEFASDHYSRAVEFELNETKKTAKVTFDYGDGVNPAHKFYSQRWGDANLTYDGRGVLSVTGYDKYRAIDQVDYKTGEMIWRLVPYYGVYRVELFPSIYDLVKK